MLTQWPGLQEEFNGGSGSEHNGCDSSRIGGHGGYAEVLQGLPDPSGIVNESDRLIAIGVQ